MLLKKLIIIIFISFSTLLASEHFPKIHQALIDSENWVQINKIVLNKDKTRLLVLSRTSLELLDAKTFKLIKNIEFRGSAWDCDFVENGFVLLTHHDFTYYNSTGAKILYRVDRRDNGQIKKIDVQDNGYIVNMIKKIGNNFPGNYNSDVEYLISFNLRNKKYSITSYKSDYVNKKYLKDIQNSVLQVSTGNHSYKYIDIKSGKKIKKSSLKTLKHNNKNILKTKKAWFYNPERETYTYGCISSDKKRYAIFSNKSALQVYAVGNKKPIFSLAYKDNSYSKRDCLIYNDTLVVQDKTFQVYNLKKDKKLFENLDTSVKVMPIIGTCVDNKFALSLWVKTMYGWDLDKGEMLWYSKGPMFNRSAWENASYYMEVESDEKWALVMPFGERNFRHELKVDLNDGSFVSYKSRAKPTKTGRPTVCDPGSEGGIGKKNSFSYKKLDFYVLSKGDWLIISPEDGYFNASSKKAISVLYRNHASLNKQDIKKWYRPDIIRAKLADKSINKLKNKKTNFVLADNPKLKNQFSNAIFSQIIKAKDYKGIYTYMRKASMDDVEKLYTVIKQSDDSESYFTFYSALKRSKLTKAYRRLLKNKRVPTKYKQDAKQYKVFLENNVKNLSSNSKEKPILIRFLANIKQDDLLKEVISKSNLDAKSKKALVSSYRVLKNYEDILWEVWEKQKYIRSLNHMKFLYEKDPKKAQILAEKNLVHLLKNSKKKCKGSQKNRQNNLCQSEFNAQRYGNLEYLLKDLYTFLTTYPPSKSLERLKKLSLRKLNSNLKTGHESYYGETKILIEFYSKHATKKEMKSLVKVTRSYLNKAVFKTKWDGQVWGKTPLSTKRMLIGSVMEGMIQVDEKFIIDLEVKIINSKDAKMREALNSEIVDFKNPIIVKNIIDSTLTRFILEGSVDNAYINKLLDTKDERVYIQLVDMFNKFKNCKKVRDWYRLKLREVLPTKEYLKLQCVPFKNQMMTHEELMKKIAR